MKSKLTTLLITCIFIGDILSQCSSSIHSVDNGNGCYTFSPVNVTPNDLYFWDFENLTSGYFLPTGYISDNITRTFRNNDTYRVSMHTFLTNCYYHDTIVVSGANLHCSNVFQVTNRMISQQPDSVSFRFNATDLPGSSANYEWNFGDGNISTDLNTIHHYKSNGTYVAVLTISDGNCYDYFLSHVVVSGITSTPNCNAGFTLYPDPNQNNSLIIANSSTGMGLNYLWDFGDGNTSTIAHPSHTYSSSGPFNLCLTVSNGNGCTSTFCDSIGSDGVIFKQSAFSLVVQSPTSTSVDIDKKESLISKLNVYPNPARNKIVLTIDLKENLMVDLYMTDLLGKSLKTIVNRQMHVGRNNLQLETDDVPNGIYLLTVQTKNSYQTLRVVVNK